MGTNTEFIRQGRPPGARNKRTAEILYRLEARGDLDPADLLSSIVTNNNEPKELRIQASGLLMPYIHSKMGTIPPARYIEEPIEVPEFTSVEIAESFLAEITRRYASGTLEHDAADSLTKMTMGWIQSQYAKQGIDLKAQAQGASNADTVIRIEGGLPALPGTNVTMPPTTVINGNQYAMLDAPQNPSSIDGVHTPEPAETKPPDPPT